MPSGSGEDQVAAALPSVQLEVPNSPVAVSGAASISVNQISEEPTAFGEVRSVVSTDGGGAATSSVPRNEISKDHGRVLVTVLKFKAHGRLYITRFFGER